MNEYETFCLYVSLKAHFNGPYNFFKYDKRTIKIPPETYKIRKDRHYFQRFAKENTSRKIYDFLLGNFKVEPKFWIGNAFTAEAYDRYMEHAKIRQSLLYHFGRELDELFEQSGKPKEAFALRNGKPPTVLWMLYDNTMHMETFIILNDILNLYEILEKLEDSTTWNDYKKRLENYTPFLKYDKKKYIKKLKEKWGWHLT